MGNVLSALTGLSAGIISGSALCALYIALGVITKSAMSLGLLKMRKVFFISNAAGAILATVTTLFGLNLDISEVFIVIFGFFAGAFIGLTIGCIADVVDSIAVLRRLGITRKDIAYIIIAFGAGKFLGSLAYWFSGAF